MSKQKTFHRRAAGLLLTASLLCTMLTMGAGGFLASAAGTTVVSPDPPASATCDPADNLIAHPDLEDANTGSFWGGFYGFGWGDVWPAVIEGEAHSGVKSLRIKSASGWEPSGDAGALTLTQDTEYIFSIWYKVVDPSKDADFVGSFLFGAEKTKLGGDFNLNADGNWHQLAIAFDSGDAETMLFHWWLGQNDDAYLLFDDACLFVKPEAAAPTAPSIVKDGADIPTCDPEDNLIANPGAEEEGLGSFMGSSTDFQYWGGISGDDFHSGTKSFVLNTQKWGSWSGTRIEPSIALEPGTDYVLSFWYKVITEKDDGQYVFKYQYRYDGETVFTTLGGDHNVETDGQWHLASVTFNSGDAAAFRLYFFAGVADSKVYFDDFYLFDAADAKEQGGGQPAIGAVITEENPENRYCEKADNLIPNYGMELGDPFWKDAKGFSWGALALDQKVVKNGVNSLRFKPVLNATTTYSDVEFSVSVEADTSYTFSVWLYTSVENEESDGSVNLRLYNGAGKMDEFKLPLAMGEGWHQYAVVLNTGDKTKLTFNAGSSSADFTAYFDDFYLCKTEKAVKDAPENTDHPPYTVCPAGDNLFPNYNLEGKDTTFWSACPGWDFGLISITDEAARSGSRSLRFKGTSPSDWQSTELKLNVKKNTDYTFSVWVKGVDSTNALIGLMAWQGNKSGWITPQTQVQATGEWYQFFFQFNSKDFDAVAFYIGASGSEGSGTIYTDDYYLFETSKGVAELPKDEDPDKPVEPVNPGTGDSLPAAALLLAAGGAAALVPALRRRRSIH